MPRNGDGSGDNGPFEETEIVHGTSGDTTLQHTKHVAPMPELETGEALPGMNASGGAAAPLNDASEEFGTNAPKHERLGDDEDGETSASGNAGSSNRQSNQQSSSGGSGISKGNQQSSSHSSNAQGTHHSSTHSSGTSKTTQSSSTHSSSTTHQSSTTSNDLEQISREKAQRYTNLNEQDVQHAGAPDKSNSEAERSRQRAPKDAGPKEDVERLHGKATLAGNDRGGDKSGGSGQHGNKGSGGGQQGGKSGSGQQDGKSGSGSGGQHDEKLGGGRGVEVEYKGHGPEDPMRHNAEKFVNLDD